MKTMFKILAATCVALTLGVAGVAQAAVGDNEAAQKMDDATSVLQQFVDIPENAVPQALLRQAYGIAVIPSVFKISFLGAVQRGTGVLSVRTRDGQWSNPTFVTLTGGSVGFQAGVSSTDIILVFKTQRSVNRIANGQINLGGDASVAAGPVGRSVGASTNMDFNAEIYSYSRSRGLFGGVSLGGSRIGIAQDMNWLFYDNAGIEASQLLTRDTMSALPPSGKRFVYTLNQYMPPSNDQFNYSADTGGGVDQTNRAAGAMSQGGGSAGNGSGQAPSYDSGRTQPYDSGQSNGITVERSGGGMSASGGAGDSQTSDYTGDSSNYSGDYSGQSGDRDGGGY